MTEYKQLGKYHILEELGRGAFATVHLARDTILRRQVALKILHPPLLIDPEFVRRFENDARAAAQLDHPHIVTVFDLGQAEGRLFIAMQYLPGGSLAERLAASGPLPFAEAVTVVLQVAAALDYAHGLGFIHRDVKPTNVLFDTRGEAVLADFGLVAAVESSVIARSSTGGTVGTPAYIPPELWENYAATPATDVYALACVLYETVTGEALFKGDTSPAVMRAHFRPAQFPATWPEGAPPEFAGFLRRALAQNPAERFPTPGAFAGALRDLVERAADPLAAPYTALQAALAAEEWPSALRLAAEIRAQDSGYRDVTALTQQAVESQARAERAQWAVQWKAQALTAAKAGDLRAARVAAQKWMEMAPGNVEAQALLARLDARRSDPTPPEETTSTVTTNLEARSRGFSRVPVWLWGVLAVVALGLAVGLGTQMSSLTVMPTPTPTRAAVVAPTATKTPRPPTPTATVTPSRPAPTPTPTPAPRRPTPTPTPTPALGDTRVREADGMVMVYVPAGEFEMGSTEGGSDERPVHIVVLDTFWIDRTEVTNGQYEQCVDAGDCGPPAESNSHTRDSYYGNNAYDNYPVLYASWHQAADYCAWAGARMPTEAEWEYAARGSQEFIYPWGDEFDGTRLNYCDANCEFDWADKTVDDGHADTAPVGSYPGGASWCGALDLTGNVWEWTADWYGDYPSGRQVNPTGSFSGEYRVLRGGSWLNDSNYVRSATRCRHVPDFSWNYHGFRCARSSE